MDYEFWKTGFAIDMSEEVSSNLRNHMLSMEISVQPPSAFSNLITYALVGKPTAKRYKKEIFGNNIEFDGYETVWHITHDLDIQRIKKAFVGHTVEQKQTRWKPFMTMDGYTMITELNLKIEVQRLLRHRLREIDSEPELRLFLNIIRRILQEALSKLAFPPYRNEHKDSSITSGIKWHQAPDHWADEIYDFWKQALTFILECEEQLSTNSVKVTRDLIVWLHDYFIGYRGRTKVPYTDDPTLIGTVDRTRLIAFHHHMSTLFSVVDKDKYRQIIMEEFAKYANETGLEFYQAYVHGILPYLKMEELLLEGGTYSAWDGISWEVFIPIILPWAKMFCTSYAIDVLALGSGHSFTSLLGVICALALFRSFGFSNAILIGNSDDMGIVWKDGKIQRIRPPLDESEMDTKLKFMLGFSYLDVKHVRPIGLKLVKDRSDSSVAYKEPMVPLTCTLSEPERDIVVEVYQGIINDTPILEYLRINRSELEDFDYFAPRVLIDQVIQNELTSRAEVI